MTVGCHSHEGSPQRIFGIQAERPHQLFMNAVAVTCTDAQTDYPDTPPLDKDQIAKILVTRDQDALLLKGSFK